jgi:hypothetical protein
VGLNQIDCNFEGMNYFLKASKGYFSAAGGDTVFKIYPEMGGLILNL